MAIIVAGVLGLFLILTDVRLGSSVYVDMIIKWYFSFSLIVYWIPLTDFVIHPYIPAVTLLDELFLNL